MDCFHAALGCFKRKDAHCAMPWPASGHSVAILIESFPRQYHPIGEFDELMALLHKHNAKCTFFFPWHELRKRGTSAMVHNFMRGINRNDHQVALQFGQSCCMQSSAQLRQDAVEALHYMQRVFGTTVSVAMVPCASVRAATALEKLGLTVVGDCRGSRVLRFADDAQLVDNVHTALEVLTVTRKSCVRLDELLDEI
jgi:hypothetical protein